jgi:hypothetical protein
MPPAKFGGNYRAELDLIFAKPDGTPLRPNSVSSVASLLFRRLGLREGDTSVAVSRSRS